MFSVADYLGMAAQQAVTYSPFLYNSCPAYRTPMYLPGYRPVQDITRGTPGLRTFDDKVEREPPKRNPFSIEAILSHQTEGEEINEEIGCGKNPPKWHLKHAAHSKWSQQTRRRIDAEFVTHGGRGINGYQLEDIVRRRKLNLPSPQRRSDLAEQHWGVPVTTRLHKSAKRIRTIFTSEQLQRLEDEFKKQQYMVGEERLVLAAELHLTGSQVKVWFQNRRIKWRKETHERDEAKLAEYRTRRDEIRRKLGLSPRRVMSPEEIKAKRLMPGSSDVISEVDQPKDCNNDSIDASEKVE